MSIRLNKALRELNIGLQTAVEFLEKRKELGEVKSEPSFKLNDEQYNALLEAFKQDADVRNKAELMSHKKQQDKKQAAEEKKQAAEDKKQTAEAQPKTKSQTFNVIGKIDLDSLNKKPKSPAPAATPASDNTESKTAAVSQKPEEKKAEPKVEAPKEEKPVAKEAPKAEKPVAAPVAEKKEEKPAAAPVAEKAPEAPAQEKAPAEKAPATAGVFKLPTEAKNPNAPKVNVLGKIDLDAINQSTRPKKKTKEEKRKEREEKAQAKNGEKKKRQRIGKERVDINAEAESNNGRNKKKNGNGNNNNPNANNANNANNGGNGKNGKNRKRNQKPLEVDDEAVARQVKETLARLTNKNQNKKGAKYRKEKREAVQEKLSQEAKAERKESKTLKLTEFVTVSELATMMDVSVTQVISTLMGVGIMVSINQRLDAETINLVAEEFGFKTEYVSAEVQEAVSVEEDDEADLVSRAPIVTVMGHVDHGKTSLLDHIRNTNVIAGEAGGITQHIGAYSVTMKNGRKVTFLDTPGHEAFTAMRARGAELTDVAILVVAADDGVMPQTVEAINHAQAAKVPIVVAVNKIDVPGANPEKVRGQLTEFGLVPEEYGGDTMFVDISAKQNLHVDKLLEAVLLTADAELDLRANPDMDARGATVEARLDKGRGAVATVLVQQGTLHVGDAIVAGTSYGRVRAMLDENGQPMEAAGPSTPVQVLGLTSVPTAGDLFLVASDDRAARQIAEKRQATERAAQLAKRRKVVSLEDFKKKFAESEIDMLNIVIKGDSSGSVEALEDSLMKIEVSDEVGIQVIHRGVGAITQNDVNLATVDKAVIIGFNVRPNRQVADLAEREGVEIKYYSVIYRAIEDIEASLKGMLKPEYEEVVTSHSEIREIFRSSKFGNIAGVMVQDGEVKRGTKCRILRNGVATVNDLEISSLRRFKDDVQSVKEGYEAGINLGTFNDIELGDIIETFEMQEVERK